MDSKTTASADEQPKRKIAKKVITAKRQYFVPTYGAVEADSAQAAATEAERLSKQKKDGDAE